MRELQNVLYVLTQGAYLHAEHDTIRVEVEGESRLRLPLMRLSAIVVFGRVMVSPSLIERCATDGRALVWLDRRGRFVARVSGPTRGNVLLRRAQHLALSDPVRPAQVARQIVAGKIQNGRRVVLRAARESASPDESAELGDVAGRMAAALARLRGVSALDEVRGIEGDAARAYFEAFPLMVRADVREELGPRGRTRRPPLDPTNALLSFYYALLRAESEAALEGVGLDPQVGYLHALRPGRPALALDVMEELRPVLADRMALTLINRRQLQREHFEELPGGAWQLTDEGRRTALTAFQRRKEEEVHHRVLRQRVPLGLLPHVQARILARHLRGDLPDYQPFLYR